jgi:hypothetical protein
VSRQSLPRRALLATALVVLCSFGLRALLDAASSPVASGSAALPWWLPAAGTVGQTVAYYLLAGTLVTTAVVPFVTFAIGYRAGAAARS